MALMLTQGASSAAAERAAPGEGWTVRRGSLPAGPAVGRNGDEGARAAKITRGESFRSRRCMPHPDTHLASISL
jgi:hypothetical protein